MCICRVEVTLLVEVITSTKNTAEVIASAKGVTRGATSLLLVISNN